MPPQTRHQAAQAALGDNTSPLSSLDVLSPNQDGGSTVEHAGNPFIDHFDDVSVAGPDVCTELGAPGTHNETDIPATQPAPLLDLADWGDISIDSSLSSGDDGSPHDPQTDPTVTPEQPVQGDDETRSCSGDSEIRYTQAETQAYINFMELCDLSGPNQEANHGTIENMSVNHEEVADVPMVLQHEGIAITPEAELDTAIAHAAHITNLGLALSASAAIYYAAINVAITKAKRGDPPRPISVFVPEVLSQACRGPVGTQPGSTLAIPAPSNPDRIPPAQGRGSTWMHAILSCVFQTTTDQTEINIKISIRSPHAHHVIDALDVYGPTDEAFHREWRYLVQSPSSYLLFSFDKLPISHHRLVPGEGVALGHLDTIHDRQHASLIQVTGQGAISLTERLGCGRYIEIEADGLHGEMEYAWFPEAEVFCLVFQKIGDTVGPNYRPRIALPSPLPRVTSPFQGPRSTLDEAHQHLNSAYPDASLHLAELYESQTTLTAPFFVRRFFQIVDPVSRAEGLLLSNLKEGVQNWNSSWEPLLRWAEKNGEWTRLEPWRQRRSKVVLEAHYGTWVSAHLTLLDAMNTYRPHHPTTGQLMQDLAPISRILTVLDAFEHGTHLSRPVDGNTPADELCAIGLKWVDLSNMRRAMRVVAQLARQYEGMGMSAEVMVANRVQAAPVTVPEFIRNLQEAVLLCGGICQSLSWV